MALAEFFNPMDGFTAPASLPNGAMVDVIFDNGFVSALDVESSGPFATCASDSVAGVRRDDEIEIQGTLYRVVGVEPDGTGITTLRLNRR